MAYGIRGNLLPGEWRDLQRRRRNICEDCGQDAFIPDDDDGPARMNVERLLCELCDRNDLEAAAAANVLAPSA